MTSPDTTVDAAASEPRPAKVRKARLRPVNMSRRRQLQEHEHATKASIGFFQEPKPGDDVLDQVHSLGFIPSAVRDLPERHIGSLQSVQAFRAKTCESEVHPDDRHLYSAAELALPTGDEYRVSVQQLTYDRNVLVEFLTEVREEADLAAEKKRKDRREKLARRAKAAGHKVATNLVEVDPDEAKKAHAEAEKWAKIRRETSEEIADRLLHGFYYAGGKVADEIVQAFCEYLGANIRNLRSRIGSPSLARIAALYPRHCRGGYDKTALADAAVKLFALDCPYVELNRKVAGCIVVELDSVLRPEEFRARLLEILGVARMPNLIVGRISPSGYLVRPHLIWLLNTPVWYEPFKEVTDPTTGEVTTTGDERCRTKPIAKFHHVQRGLTQQLLPLGADPAMRNLWKPKNPLSPFWTTIIGNDDNFHDLGDFEKIKNWPREVNENGMAVAAALMRAEANGMNKTASNFAWNFVGSIIEPMAGALIKDRDKRDPSFVAAARGGLEALAAWFDDRVRPLAEMEIEAGPALDVIIERRCLFHARWCLGKISKRRGRVGRGRDRKAIFDGNLNTKEARQHASATTGSHRHNVTMWRLCQELSVAMKATGAVDKTAFIKDIALVGKSFAYEHWDEACRWLKLEFREGAYRYIAPPDRGQDDHSDLPSEPIRASDSTLPTPAIPGHPVRTSESVLIDTVAGPSEPGVDDPPWLTHAPPTVDVRQRVVSCVPEPA
ncbi:hypothetical protein [Bradyrhizobium diazoefficiens]|uniref:hypothetical protein n=1 Tax=Bradyrhizobium diazoefficiens TaxID=1355477 RepID=UPI0004B31BB4|nr:hypothetical protein [Bradyrhizobium diazoefficiens]